MQSILLISGLVFLAMAVPTEYDLRVQSSVVKYADYDIYNQGICAGYTWAKQLAQIVSNFVSLDQSQRMSLSAQQLLDCTETFDDKCYKATRQNILRAMAQISKAGLTANDCYLNRPFEHPSNFCKRQCDDGDQFDFVFKANFKKYDSITDIFNLFKTDDKVTAFAIIKVDDTFNFYSSFNNNLGNVNQFYEYRVAEIVGWKNAQKKVTLRAGPGSFWGYKGYIDLDLEKNKNYITDLYVVIPTSNLNLMQQ